MKRPRWLQDLMAIGWPVALYGVGVVLAAVTFTGAVVLTQDEGVDEKDVVMLGAIWACALGGVAGGQLLSITRVRSGLVLPGLFVAFWAGIWFIATYEDALESALGDTMAGVLLLSLILLPIMTSGGFWSLRVNRGLAAAWAPSLLFIASILIVSEHQDRDDLWRQGAKYAIWSVGTVAVLATAITVQLVFMAARERHRLHRWRTSALAPELVDARPDPFRPLSGLGTLLMLGLLVLVLTGGSAVVAPYLWRTGGDGDEPGDPDDVGTEPDPDDGGSGWRPPNVGKGLRQGAGVACALLTMLVLALVGLFVFGPPTRRQLLLAHLREPMWPVPPSRRARLHWRLAEIALGDAGVHRQPGESARDVALRGVAAMPRVNLEALVSAAEIADRVNYGYALEASDADTIRRAAEMTYQAVWDGLGELDRVKATYRFL